MITQDFLNEFEASLLRSYSRAARKSDPAQMPQNFVQTVSSQHDFMSAFMHTFDERKSILEDEIRKGGHRDSDLLATKIRNGVETKLRTALLQKGHKLDQYAFQKLVRDLKWEVRSVFYE